MADPDAVLAGNDTVDLVVPQCVRPDGAGLAGRAPAAELGCVACILVVTPSKRSERRRHSAPGNFGVPRRAAAMRSTQGSFIVLPWSGCRLWRTAGLPFDVGNSQLWPQVASAGRRSAGTRCRQDRGRCCRGAVGVLARISSAGSLSWHFVRLWRRRGWPPVVPGGSFIDPPPGTRLGAGAAVCVPMCPRNVGDTH